MTDVSIDPGKLKPKRLKDLKELIEGLGEKCEEATDLIGNVDDAVEALAAATTRDDRETYRDERDSERESLAETLCELAEKMDETLQALAARGLQA